MSTISKTGVQATHTPSEQLVHQSLWPQGVEQADGSHIAAASYSALARMTGHDSKTVARSISGLVPKGHIARKPGARSRNPTQ